MKSISLIISVITLCSIVLRADKPATLAPAALSAAAPASPAVDTVAQPTPPPTPMVRREGGAPETPFRLTPEESKVINEARIALQKDPEIIDLNNQIKALMEKRMKLTEEKIQKISPEAAVVFQKIKERQEKMMAERKAQIDAMQAKVKAMRDAKTAASPVFIPAPSIAVPTP